VPSDIGIGDAKYKDLNHDGKISLYGDTPGQDGDVVNLGSATPRFIYGMNLNLTWKSFDLGVFMQGVGNRTLIRTDDYSMPWSDWWRQPPLFYYGNTWNEDRPNARNPRLSHGSIRSWNYQPSTLTAINAAYLRLKNLPVGYSLPEALTRRAGLSAHGFTSVDSTCGKRTRCREAGIRKRPRMGSNYPFQRLYSVGADITF